MKRVLRQLNREGQTIIHVTHDYIDAISLAERVGVIHNGRIIQEGSVDDVFNRPVNRFVARYAGMKNFFRLRVMKEDGVVKAFTSNNLELRIPGNGSTGDCLAVMKSRDIKLSHDKPSENGHNIIKGKVDEIIRSEYGMEISVSAGDLFHAEISGREFNELGIKEKDEVWMSFPKEVIIILGTGQSD
jgi:ABC-type Fe3+/spermidine/putrescine transport system ATPase subunit